MTLPKMDVPIDVVEWELFVPEQFKVDHFEGNLIDANLLPVLPMQMTGQMTPQITPQWGQIGGVVTDASGAVIPGAQVTLVNGTYRQTVMTDANGTYIASNVPSGAVTIRTELSGFKPAQRTVQFAQSGQRADTTLALGAMSESVTVVAEAPVVDTRSSQRSTTLRASETPPPPPEVQKQKKDENEAPSLNVQNLQRRASGVLPVRIDVPRAGSARRFVKPLVVDEETQVTFRYKRR